MQLLDELLALYEQGSIVGKSEQFYLSWQLEVDERGIWHPSWWNTLLTEGDTTLYLTKIASPISSYEEEAARVYLRLEAIDE
ncbi:Hypothetical protein POVR2_LOCUS320 [uncultured virus]|nr:Hypothetical protein POVR2_LOCUS320 [uncultured virus]